MIVEHARNRCRSLTLFASAAGLGVCTLFAAPAMAYVGPGAGIGIIGALLAIGGIIVVTLVGLVLWPLRLLRRRMHAKGGAAAQTADSTEAIRR
jgi:Na+/melibiose symporter-like transporter